MSWIYLRLPDVSVICHKDQDDDDSNQEQDVEEQPEKPEVCAHLTFIPWCYAITRIYRLAMGGDGVTQRG